MTFSERHHSVPLRTVCREMVGAVIITWVTTGSVMLAKTEELVFERCIAGERKKMKKGKTKCTRTPILSLSRTHRKREKERKRERKKKKGRAVGSCRKSVIWFVVLSCPKPFWLHSSGTVFVATVSPLMRAHTTNMAVTLTCTALCLREPHVDKMGRDGNLYFSNTIYREREKGEREHVCVRRAMLLDTVNHLRCLLSYN